MVTLLHSNILHNNHLQRHSIPAGHNIYALYRGDMRVWILYLFQDCMFPKHKINAKDTGEYKIWKTFSCSRETWKYKIQTNSNKCFAFLCVR